MSKLTMAVFCMGMSLHVNALASQVYVRCFSEQYHVLVDGVVVIGNPVPQSSKYEAVAHVKIAEYGRLTEELPGFVRFDFDPQLQTFRFRAEYKDDRESGFKLRMSTGRWGDGEISFGKAPKFDSRSFKIRCNFKESPFIDPREVH